MTVRLFVGLWLGLTGIICAYAFVDLTMNPWLLDEGGLTLRPDLSQVGSLVHWGGRLLRASRATFLVNAVLMGGVLALGLQSVIARLRRKSVGGTRISIYPAMPRHSVPPSVG